MHKATVLVQYSCSIRINCFPKQLSAKQFRSQFFLPRRKLFQVGLADHLTFGRKWLRWDPHSATKWLPTKSLTQNLLRRRSDHHRFAGFFFFYHVFSCQTTLVKTGTTETSCKRVLPKTITACNCGEGRGCLKQFIPKEHDLTLSFHFKCESYSSMFKFSPDFPKTSSSAYFAVQSWNISTSPFIGCTAPFINGLSKNST